VTAELFLRGLAIGFAIAFALGPIGLLVIRRTIERGWGYGLSSGVGVATADAAYAALAAFGVTALTEILTGIDRLLGIVGGAVLLVLATRALVATRSAGTTASADVAPADAPGQSRPAGAIGAWASMVALTLTNPATILSFAALFASLGAGSAGAAGAAAVVAGVFAGSVAWWALLTGIVAGLRARLTPRVVRAFNVASALIIGAFGAVAIVLGLAG
jgi:threonine/homoserine/homoserine lactone efflux protein